MTFLLFQAFLLMAAAYFLGAFLGCWWRRTFYAPIETRTMSTAEPVAAGAAISGAGALNVPRSDPIPVQPRIEYVDTPQATVDRHRFERALSGVGGLEEDEVAGEPAMPPPTASTPAPAVTEAAPHFEGAPRPPVTPAPIEDMPKPDLAAAKTTDDAMAAAAAAAAAAIGIAARSRAAAETTRRTAPPVVTAASVSHPVAASGGMAGVAADVRTPPLVPADSQDLKLIAGVDDAAERALHSLGVWRYADISRWTAGDVASVNAALGSQGRVQHQNWIEQAAVLAKGAHTLYARRRLRGELASAFPTETARPARGPVPGAAAEPPLPAEPTPASAPRSPQASASAAAVAVAAAAAAATRGRAAATGQRPLMPVRAPRPVISEIGSGPVPAAAEPPPAKSPPPPPAAPPAPAPQPPVAMAAAQSLQRIRGIDQAAERVLNEHDISRYEQIARWTATEVDYFNELLDMPGRVSHQNWIEQAQVLARGATTLFARQYDSGLMQIPGGAAAVAAAAASAAVPAESRARPSRLVDAMRQNMERSADPARGPERAPPPVPAAAPSSEATPATAPSAEAPSAPSQMQTAAPAGSTTASRTDVSSLRSVRSEALRSVRFPTSSVSEDLKRIRGIGVLIEKKLNSLGISSYDQIANWTATDIAHVSEVLDFRGRIERENWVEQARILSAGGQTEFSRRRDRGEAG